MHSNLLLRPLFAALFLAAFAVAASAQTTQVNGTVKLKQADGTEVPVVGAQIDIYRTDMKGEYHTKTDKKGHYIHAGLPFAGTFTVIVSAPGVQPTYASRQRFDTSQQRDFLVQPGDGSTLTLEQTKRIDAGGSGGDPAPSESEEDKARREELDRKIKEVEEKNRKIEEGNAVISRTFKAGNNALAANRLDEAIAFYREGLAARPDEPALLTNLSEALRRRGVIRFNEAQKGTDADAKTRALDESRKDWKDAADSSQKALQIIGTGGSDPQQAAIYAQTKIAALSTRALAMRLVATKLDQSQAQAAWDAYQEYIAVEADPAKKAKAQLDMAQMLLDARSFENALVEFQAILEAQPDSPEANLGAGLAAYSTGDKTKLQEAANYLQHFVEVAPDSNPMKADVRAILLELKNTENITPQ